MAVDSVLDPGTGGPTIAIREPVSTINYINGR
jgi:hypothetical protein